jgi:predicted dehydrogenase
VKVAIIGTGFGRRVVAPVFAETPGCEVAGVVSARDDAEIAELVTRPDVDLVSVHSPPFLHAVHLRAALASGKAVLCDKPFAMTVPEADALVREATDAAVVHLCNFEFRYQPARRMLRTLVRDGSLGPVEHVSWTHYSAGSRVPLRPYGWLFDRARGGGWIGAWASHAVDTLRFLFGEVVHATGAGRTDIATRPDDAGAWHTCTAEDGLSAWLELDGGITVAIDSTFAATANVAPRLTVFGRDAVCEVVADQRVTVRRADGAHEEIALESAPQADRHDTALRAFAPVVRDAVHDGVAPDDAPTFADGAACDRVLARLREGT